VAFNPSYVTGWNFDQYYQELNAKGVTVSPCLQTQPPHLAGNRHSEGKPIDPQEDPYDPRSYREHAHFMFQYAARYGHTAVASGRLKLRGDQALRSGLGYLDYLENWNEPDKWWHGDDAYFDPFAFAAMCSADYDGHEGALGSDYGVKSADRQMKMVMGGLAELNLDYLKSMLLWSQYHRQTGFPADVLNFHHYSNDAGGQFGNAQRGISPESDQLEAKLRKLVQFRDKYLPGKEIWLSEFGYDTNENSVQGTRRIGQKEAVTVQAEWLIRSFLAAVAAGIDKAQIFMLRDVNNPNPTKYNSSGLTAEKWNQHQAKKSFHYLAGFKKTVANFHFREEMPSGDSRVKIYAFENQRKDSTLYAIWTPTESDLRIPAFQLSLPGVSRAQLYELLPTESQVQKRPLTIQNGKASLPVSEMPVFVKVVQNDSLPPVMLARDQHLYLDAAGVAQLQIDSVDAGSSDETVLLERWLSQSDFSGADLPAGQKVNQIPVYLLGRDHQNRDSVQFTVHLNDTLKPVARPRAVVAYLDAQGQVRLDPWQVDQGSGDNVAVITDLWLSDSVFTCADLNQQPSLSIVSDHSWRQSSYVSTLDALTFPWAGTAEFPDTASYTEAVMLGQPYHYHSLDTVPGTRPIRSPSYVSYYRKRFNLSHADILRATLQMTVDDDMDIFVNGKHWARENVWGLSSRGPRAIHAFEAFSGGTVNNGWQGHTAFGWVAHTPLSELFKVGENEILVVVRNGANNQGGFSLRLDLYGREELESSTDQSWQLASLASPPNSLPLSLPPALQYAPVVQVQSQVQGLPGVNGKDILLAPLGSYAFKKTLDFSGKQVESFNIALQAFERADLFLNGQWLGSAQGVLQSFQLAWVRGQGFQNGGAEGLPFDSISQVLLENVLLSGVNELVILVQSSNYSTVVSADVRWELLNVKRSVLHLRDSHGDEASAPFVVQVLDTLGACQNQIAKKGPQTDVPAPQSNPDLNGELSLYPNPAGEQVLLQWDQVPSRNFEIQILNNQGQLVWHQEGRGVQNHLSLQGLAKGAYWLRVWDRGRTKVMPLIKG